MTDSDGKKPLGLGGAPRSGQVKQSFSHGRTKSVVVETKRKRVVVPVAAGKPSVTATAAPSSDCPQTGFFSFSSTTSTRTRRARIRRQR